MTRPEIISATMALAVISGPLFAQQTKCGPRDHVLGQLENRYGEARMAYGLAPNNSLVEFFASEERATFTVLISKPNGISCILVDGTEFELIPREETGEDF